MTLENNIPTKEDIELARNYLVELDSLKTHPSEQLPEDLLIETTPMWLGIIEKFGNGDIKVAAQKHIKAIQSFYNEASKEEAQSYHEIVFGKSDESFNELMDKVFNKNEN